MTVDPQKTSEDTPPAQDLVRNMQRVGDHLLAGMESDSRVQSGVPGGRLSGDLDFIQMTGLTRPGASQDHAAEAPPQPSNADLSGPLSFYEKGVADVDFALAPHLRDSMDELPGAGLRGAPSSPHPRETYSIDELKQIISELSQGELGSDKSHAGVGVFTPPAAEASDATDVMGSARSGEAEDFSGDSPTPSDVSDGEGPPDTMQTVLLTKTDSLADLLQRELASHASEAAEEPAASVSEPDQTPLLEPVHESPETPVLEPIAHEGALEHSDAFSSAFDEFADEHENDVSFTASIPELSSEESLVESFGFLTKELETPNVLGDYVEAPADSFIPLAQEVAATDSSGKDLKTEGPERDREKPVGSHTAPVPEPETARPYSHDLAEVEQLLRTLQEQPRDIAPTSKPPTSVSPGTDLARSVDEDPAAGPGAGASEPFGREKDESVYRRPQERRRKRKTRIHGRLRRRMARLSVLATLLALMVCAGYMTYRWSKRGLTTPGTYLSDAAVQVSKGHYEEAAREYADFVARNPNHSARADAQFNAAFYLQATPPEGAEADSSVTGAARLEQSLTLLRQFVEENPLHAKAARAKTLIGLLQFRLKHYKEAIDQLHSPGLRLEDPYASLVILRTLASSYARTGDFESARSAYLQAASLPDNYSPDKDYQELSDLCKSMADQASTPEESRRYLELSAEQLSHAILTPGIDPVTKKRLQSLLAARQSASESAPEPGAAPPAPVAAPAAPPAAESAPASPVTAPAPVAPTTLNAEPDPRLEAEQLNAGAIKPTPAPADTKDAKP